MPDITQVGVGGIFALLIIKEVLTFLRLRKNGDGNADHDDLLKIHFILVEIRTGQDKVRESNHKMVEKLQEIAYRLGDRRANQ